MPQACKTVVPVGIRTSDMPLCVAGWVSRRSRKDWREGITPSPECPLCRCPGRGALIGCTCPRRPGGQSPQNTIKCQPERTERPVDPKPSVNLEPGSKPYAQPAWGAVLRYVFSVTGLPENKCPAPWESRMVTARLPLSLRGRRTADENHNELQGDSQPNSLVWRERVTGFCP